MEQVMNEKTIYRAALYCRLSKDDEQAGDSVSIETQRMMLTGFCYERGFKVYEVYTDIYFSQKKVRYIAVNDGIDTSREDNDIAPFKNILNDMYAKDLSRKVKSAKRQRAYQGFYISAQAPYGYKVDPEDKNHLIVDEEAAEVVREIFNLALEGNGMVRIANILTERKVLTPGFYKAEQGDMRFLRYQDRTSPFGWCYQTIRKTVIWSTALSAGLALAG